MSGVSRQGRGQKFVRYRAIFRPSAPILLVAAAVVLIAVATDMSSAGLHPSLPSAITLPAPDLAPPSGDTGPAQGGAVTAATDDPTQNPPSTTTTTARPDPPPTTVDPLYPVGSATPVTAAATPSRPPAQDGAGATGGSDTPSPDGSKDSTETVPPNYPVVTSSGTTGGPSPTSSTTDG